MQRLYRLSVAELCAEHLREGLREGRWQGALPGVARLAAELDVSRDTLRAALRSLETAGMLDPRGPGRSRTVTARGVVRRRLRVGILLHDALPDEQNKVAQLLLQIQRDLGAKDHEVFCLHKTQVQLRHDVRRITRLLGENPADAWIVVAGSRELLEWITKQPTPCLCLYGRADGLLLARTGPDKAPAYVAATRRLLALGHRRIVLIARRARRKPIPGNAERAFRDELEAHGILTGDYHLPDWEETPQGFANLLERLFQRTPPTALIIDESAQFIAAMEFLARRRIHVPEQVSLVATGDDAALAWCRPGIAHIKSDTQPIIRRIVRWVAAVRKGTADRKTINYPAKFVAGGSIGPVGGKISGR
jgi:DNA-binding LacI/PurR family transcriptional regulator